MSVPDRSGRIIRKGDLQAEFALMRRAQQQQEGYDEGFAGSAASAGMSMAEVKQHLERSGRDMPVRGADIASGMRRKGIRKQYTGTAFKE